MSAEVHIVEGPLPPAEPWRVEGAGAVLCFEGVVRPQEEGRQLAALDYEEYPPMTRRELERLAHAVLGEDGLIAIRVDHSRGEVPVGACSFRLRVAAEHRKETIAAIDRFIDRMKRDVPLWKNPVWIEQAESP